MLITAEEAKACISNVEEPVWRTVADAHRILVKHFLSVHPAMDDSTIAKNMQSLIIDQCLPQHCEGLPGVKVLSANGRSLLSLRSGVLLQFKKLNARGQIENYPTRTARRFQAQAELPKLPRGPRLTIGYKLSAAGTELLAVRCMLFLKLRRSASWEFELRAPIVALPFSASDAPPPAAPTLADVLPFPGRRRGGSSDKKRQTPFKKPKADPDVQKAEGKTPSTPEDRDND